MKKVRKICDCQAPCQHLQNFVKDLRAKSEWKSAVTQGSQEAEATDEEEEEEEFEETNEVVEKKVISLFCTDIGTIDVQMLEPNLALVVDPLKAMKVSKNDILRLESVTEKDPQIRFSSYEISCQASQALYQKNRVLSRIPFFTRKQERLMIALAVVLDVEVRSTWFRPWNKDPEIGFGVMGIAHPENIDLLSIAVAAGILDQPRYKLRPQTP